LRLVWVSHLQSGQHETELIILLQISLAFGRLLSALQVSSEKAVLRKQTIAEALMAA